MKLDEFNLLTKREQKSELTRVNEKYRKRYATTGNKINNGLVYKKCLDENEGLEVKAQDFMFSN
jgi:hypothetical protein